MKKSLLLASLAFSAILTPGLASAAPMTCRSTNAGPDRGTYVYVSASLRFATVKEMTIAGEQTLASLRCSRLPAPRRRGPDQAFPFLACSEPGRRDSGYSVMLTTGGFAGRTMGAVYQHSFRGRSIVAKVICDHPAQ